MMHPVTEAEQLAPVRNETGQIVLRVGLIFTVYFENGFTSPVRERIGACLEHYRSLCGDRLRWMVNPTSDKWQHMDELAVRMLHDCLRHGVWDYSWATSWQGGRNPQEASDYRIKVFAKDGPLPKLSYLQLTVPINWRDSPSAFLNELCLPICETLRPYSGYGGCGVVDSSNMALADEVQPTVFALAQRFPGIEVDKPLTHMKYADEGIKGVNWLTVLGSHWVGAMGGAEKLREALPPVAKLHEFSGGVLIQAGEGPVTGDVNQRIWPTAYAEVAQVMSPIRLKEAGCFHYAGPGRFTRETSAQWLTRFDRPPPFEPMVPPVGTTKEGG